MQTIVELPEFIKQANKLGLTNEERNNIVDTIAAFPEIGDEISGTGGMRKVRIAGRGKGKSGGYRVITFFSGKDIPTFLIYMYGKDQKANITQQEKNTMKQLSGKLVEIYRRNKR